MNPLESVTVRQRADRPRSRPVAWYRTRIDPAALKALHERSDLLGFAQTLGFLAVLAATGSAVLYAAGRFPWYVVVLLLFLHGTFFAFQINAVHELGHGTVFRTKFFNEFFVRIFAFLGWIGYQKFNTSHARHHRYTLHPPDDLEVVLPIRLMAKEFFKTGFVNLPGFWFTLKETVRLARGKFCGEWELALFPADDPERRRPIIRWARLLLFGHGLILVLAVVFQIWLLPVVVSLGTFYGGWLFFLCNNTQHIGLQDNVADFRLCCRTFTVNPVVQFIYWHMNYHIEHHMFAAVPCYRLGRLHRAIQHDLPPCPKGIIATWREIAAIQKRQDADPTYQYVAPVPQSPQSSSA